MIEDLETRRRRIKFRAWHRGMREMDLLLGPFVDAELASFDAQDVADFEALLDVPDQTAFQWMLGTSAPDPAHDTPVWRRLTAFHKR